MSPAEKLVVWVMFLLLAVACLSIAAAYFGGHHTFTWRIT
jgi:hypothetical protein